MGKRSKRAQRRREERRKTLRSSAIALVFGLAMLGLGIFGLTSNNAQLREYQSSPDVRTVEATVTAVDVREGTTDDDAVPDFYYHTTLEFVVGDSATFTGTVDYGNEKRVGETVEVEAYQRKDGSYAVANITNGTQGFLSNIPMYLALGVGALVTLAAVVVGVGAFRSKP